MYNIDPAIRASEGEFVLRVAPGLIQRSDRFFTAPRTDKFSYPLSAQAQFATIEETSFWFRHRNEVIGTLVRRFPPFGPILDIGGGNGYVSSGLTRRGFSTIVLEPGVEGAEIAHERGFTVIQAGFTPETFAARSLPAIGLFDVIEHIANDQQFLADCGQALVHGGMLYVTVPAFNALWSSDDEFAGHFRRYSRASLTRVLRVSGFEVAFASPFFSPLIVPLFILRSLPSALGWRKVSTVDQAVAHHHARRRITNLLDWLLGWELRSFKGGHPVLLGTSLIAIARKL